MKHVLLAALLLQPFHFPPVDLKAPDLIVVGVPHLNEDRTIGFIVGNRSNIASGPARAVLSVNGVRQSFDLPILRAYSIHAVHTTDVWLQCTQPLSLRVTVDPDNQVAEADETNNSATNSIAVPCPDVSASIRKDWTDYNTRYKAQISIFNKGGVVMPQVNVRTLGFSFRPNDMSRPPTDCLSDYKIASSCMKDDRLIGPIAPGQSIEFEPGGKYDMTEKLNVQVDITCGTPPPQGKCTESDYNNNTVRKGL